MSVNIFNKPDQTALMTAEDKVFSFCWEDCACFNELVEERDLIKVTDFHFFFFY